MGMVGGGQGAFIGAVHRIAAAIDQQIDLVCGAFSSSPEKSLASGAELGIPESRCYGSYKQMIEAEADDNIISPAGGEIVLQLNLCLFSTLANCSETANELPYHLLPKRGRQSIA